jgi:Serpin (serine protease inhibitor)
MAKALNLHGMSIHDADRAYRGVIDLLQGLDSRSFVDVNEEGTVDRPFMFAIRERLTGTILFLGKITDPRVSATPSRVPR